MLISSVGVGALKYRKYSNPSARSAVNSATIDKIIKPELDFFTIGEYTKGR